MVVSSHVPMHQQLASSGSLYIVHVTGRPAGQQLTISTPAPLILHAAPGTPAAGPTPRTSWATTSRWRSGSRRTVPTTALSRRGSRSVIHRRRRRRLQALKQACLLCCVDAHGRRVCVRRRRARVQGDPTYLVVEQDKTLALTSAASCRGTAPRTSSSAPAMDPSTTTRARWSVDRRLW
jgi:hypothetical protein